MKVPTTPRTFCYDNSAKQALQRKVRAFYRAALRQLPDFAQCAPIHFNPGGIAVWGEVYLRIAHVHNGTKMGAVEAFNTDMGLLVRQWDGRNSGRNHYVQTLDEFTALVRKLASEPFVRF